MLEKISAPIQYLAIREPDQALAWDEFLKRECPNVHIEQTTSWGKFRQLYGWNPNWAWASRGTQILGGALILTRRIGPFATIGYVERGPVWDPAEPEAPRLAIEAVRQAGRRLRISYLAMSLPYDGEEIEPLLKTRKFRLKPGQWPPTGVGRATLIIDLRKDLDTLFGEMSMTKRQNIRRGLRKHVQVRSGGAEDAETMRKLMWLGCKRRGIKPAPPQKDYFDNLWQMLGPSGAVRFFIAEINGEPVSAACALLCSGSMQLWRVGWSGKHDGCDPNDVLHWEMMKWAKEHGFQQFDFLHIRPDHARAILRGEKVKDSYSGVTDYKLAFGGQLRVLPELYYFSFQPVVQMALEFVGERFINTNRGPKLLNVAARRWSPG